MGGYRGIGTNTVHATAVNLFWVESNAAWQNLTVVNKGWDRRVCWKVYQGSSKADKLESP